MNSKKMPTRELIIAVAGDLFMDRGFQATSTRMIAEMAGITQPNLYHHFKTKEDIYIAVLEALSREVKEALEQLVAADGQALEVKLQEVLEFLKEKHPVNMFMMRHDMEHEISPENRLFLYRIWHASYLRPLVTLFENHAPAESPLTPEELARHFYTTIAPYVQKGDDTRQGLSPGQVIYLFVYGILDRN